MQALIALRPMLYSMQRVMVIQASSHVLVLTWLWPNTHVVLVVDVCNITEAGIYHNISLCLCVDSLHTWPVT